MGYSKALLNLLKGTQQGVSYVDTTPTKAAPTSSEQTVGSDIDKVKYAVEILASEKTGIEIDSEGNPISSNPNIKNKFYAERNKLLKNKDKIMAAAAAGISVDPEGNPRPQNMNEKIAYDRAYESMFGNVGKNKGKEPAVISDNIMDAYTPYKDGSATDYTANKTVIYFTDLANGDIGTGQRYIQRVLAETDQETGIRYVTVDGLVDANGESAKVYCAAFGGVVNEAATGEARCGDIVKVTWDDGTYDYMVVSDAKGDYELGHTKGVSDHGYIPGASNAIELVLDYSNESDLRKSMSFHGSFGTGANSLNMNIDGAAHWMQGFSNIEVLDYNVVPANYADLA